MLSTEVFASADLARIYRQSYVLSRPQICNIFVDNFPTFKINMSWACKHVVCALSPGISKRKHRTCWIYRSGRHIELTNTYLVQTACLPVNRAWDFTTTLWLEKREKQFLSTQYMRDFASWRGLKPTNRNSSMSYPDPNFALRTLDWTSCQMSWNHLTLFNIECKC
jgi:hypothetical protein